MSLPKNWLWKLFFLCIAIGCAAAKASAVDVFAPTAFHGFWYGRPSSPDDPKGTFYVSLLLKNQTSGTIRVPTQYQVEYLLSKPENVILNLIVRPETVNDVVPIVPEADLRIVELHPGEVAWVAWKRQCDAMPSKPLKVRFVVEKTIADRYQLWSGELEVQSQRATEEVNLASKPKHDAGDREMNRTSQP